MKLTIYSAETQSDKEVLRFDHTFELEEQAEWLALTVNYSSCDGFYLFVIDSCGRVRKQYYGKREQAVLVLHQDGAKSSCGCVSGELQTGRWHVQIIAYTKNHPVQYTIDIAAGTGEPDAMNSLPEMGEVNWVAAAEQGNSKFSYPLYDWDKSYIDERRWYKGDFHMHTQLSDGKQTVRQLNDLAISQGLDFIVITEHNIMTPGWPESPLLVIPGIEYTPALGHFNALGIREWIDIFGGDADSAYVKIETQSGINWILEEAGKQGAVRSMNHPMLTPWHW